MKPFATMARAQEAVRGVNGGMQGDIVVYLRGGVYSLANTWTLDQRDSGTNGFRVIWAGYPGENVGSKPDTKTFLARELTYLSVVLQVRLSSVFAIVAVDAILRSRLNGASNRKASRPGSRCLH